MAAYPASSTKGIFVRLKQMRVNSNPRRVFSLCPLRWVVVGAALAMILFAADMTARAQESPYIVTYDHYMEEPGSLDVEYFAVYGTQRAGNDFHGYWAEFEYGATAWWTTELYLDGQTTFGDSTIFTGYRWENRFRVLPHEHFINPVLY